jgi:pantetheine-phosphate adenylyltransferase
MTSERSALFPGTFDPFTNGHLDLTRRAARLFDRVVVGVAESPAKGTLFPVPERVEMIRSATRGLRRIEVVEFSDLLVECARRVGAQVIIRGLRAVSDFEFEFQMALMNRRLSPSIEVAFLMPSPQYTYLNSTLVKEVARLGGSVTGLVPGVVEERLREKLGLPARPRARSATTKAGRASVDGEPAASGDGRAPAKAARGARAPGTARSRRGRPNSATRGASRAKKARRRVPA